MSNMVKLKRLPSGVYSAQVRAKDSSLPPFELRVYPPDPYYPQPPGYRWLVETDDERFFATLAGAKAYINRFFEPAE